MKKILLSASLLLLCATSAYSMYDSSDDDIQSYLTPLTPACYNEMATAIYDENNGAKAWDGSSSTWSKSYLDKDKTAQFLQNYLQSGKIFLSQESWNLFKDNHQREVNQWETILHHYKLTNGTTVHMTAATAGAPRPRLTKHIETFFAIPNIVSAMDKAGLVHKSTH